RDALLRDRRVGVGPAHAPHRGADHDRLLPPAAGRRAAAGGDPGVAVRPPHGPQRAAPHRQRAPRRGAPGAGRPAGGPQPLSRASVAARSRFVASSAEPPAATTWTTRLSTVSTPT